MSTARRWMGIGRASRTLWLAGTLVCTACGGERAPDAPESESASAVNHAPRIAQVEIAPGAPKVGDLLTLESSVEDPDGDDIELQVEWYVNREVQETTGVDFETSELKRGD